MRVEVDVGIDDKKVQLEGFGHDGLNRWQFPGEEPTRLVWLDVVELGNTDITEHHTGDRKLYLCAINDLWSTGLSATSSTSGRKSGSRSRR